MMLVFEPIWSWLWSWSLSSPVAPLEDLGAGRLAFLLTVWFLALVLIMPGQGDRRLRRIGIWFGAPVLVLVLALMPVGLVLALAVAGLTVWTYLGVPNASPRRILAVLGLRLAALALAFSLVLRPSLAFRDDLPVPSALLVAVDSSDSMNIQDELGGKSRWERALDVLRSNRCAGLLKKLRVERNIQVFFYRAAEDVVPFDPVERPGRADGKRTDIGQWLQSLYQRHARDPNLRALVLFSDGADNGTRYRPLDLAELWQRVPCPIHTFALGKKETTLQQQDLAFLPDSITTDPAPVPVKNRLTVKARLRVNGYTSPRVTLRLFLDDSTEAAAVKEVTLDRPVDGKTNTYEVQLACDAPPRPGEIKVTLKADELPGELTTANNQISTFVTVTKEGLSVLYVDGQLRWEARFIRDALSAHRNIRLYKAFRMTDGPADGNADLYRFDKQHYDVIIIGDISARRFSGASAKVLEKIKELVKEGTGLMMLGGFESFGNSDWASFGKPVADVLPVELNQKGNVPDVVKVKMVPTAAGFDHYILRMLNSPADNRKFWETQMPPLEGMTLLGDPKQGATVLATRDNDPKQPILVATTFGKGRTLAFACDSTWSSWRRTPETYKAHMRFWQQVVTYLAHQEEMEDTVWVRPDARRLAMGSKLGFSLGMRGKGDQKVENAKFQARVIGPQKAETVIPTVKEAGEERGTFWKTDAPGEYRLEVTALDAGGKPLPNKTARARFLVYEDDVEYRRPAADPEALAKIANRSDGKAHLATEAEFARFLGDLQNQPLPQGNPRPEVWPDWKRNPSTSALDDQIATLWASGVLAVFLLFVTLVCLEWYLRRRWGLV
jgi:uncharacterized membrane protein